MMMKSFFNCEMGSKPHSSHHTQCHMDQIRKLLWVYFENFKVLGKWKALLFGGRPRCVACGILLPWPGLNPGPQQWEHGVLTTGPPGNSQHYLYLKHNYDIFSPIKLLAFIYCGATFLMKHKYIQNNY